MSINSLQKQTNINIQEKANLIWEIATHLVGLFKPHEYGKVILPMTVLKRFDDALAPTKQAVVEMGEKLAGMKVEGEARDGILCKTSGYSFYNTSKFDFKKLVSDPDNIESNFENYLQGFSSNVKDIISNFKFTDQVIIFIITIKPEKVRISGIIDVVLTDQIRHDLCFFIDIYIYIRFYSKRPE